MLRNICRVILALTVTLSAISCQSAQVNIPPVSTLTSTMAIPMSLETTAISTRSAPTITPSAVTPPMQIRQQPGPFYEVAVTVPLGQNGVSYRGVGNPNMEITGPNALAILPDGSFVVADLIDNRLLQYDINSHFLKAIDLSALDIMNISDLRATDVGLFVLEISFNVDPRRYKIHQLLFNGDLKASFDIPEGFHLENGLSGIAIGSQGQILLEMEGGSRLYQLDEQPGSEPHYIAGYPFYGRNYELHSPVIGQSAAIKVGDINFTTKLSKQLGGLTFLQACPDGSFYAIRSDVVNDQVIQTDQTVHYVSGDGVQRGVARVPLAEYYYPVRRNLAVSPGGDVFALLPRPNSIKIIRLYFYKSIEPLIPGAVEPQIKMNPG